MITKPLNVSAVELEKLSAEKEEIHAEYEQERIAYQKLLKEYNRLELQRDNLQVIIYSGSLIGKMLISIYFFGPIRMFLITYEVLYNF